MQGDLRKIQAEFWDPVNSDFVSLENIRFTNICPRLGGLASLVSVFLQRAHGGTRRTHMTVQKAQALIPAPVCCCTCGIWVALVRLANVPGAQHPGVIGGHTLALPVLWPQQPCKRAFHSS